MANRPRKFMPHKAGDSNPTKVNGGENEQDTSHAEHHLDVEVDLRT